MLLPCLQVPFVCTTTSFNLQLTALDIMLFLPLLTAYLVELLQHLQCSKGLLPVKTSNFFAIFWASYNISFTSVNILKVSAFLIGRNPLLH
jgi:hypothetical protein